MVMDWIDQGIARKLDKTCLCDQVMVVHWSGTLRAMFPLVPRWHRSTFLLTSPFLPGSKRVRTADLLYRNLSPSPASFMAFPPVFSLSPSCLFTKRAYEPSPFHLVLGACSWPTSGVVFLFYSVCTVAEDCPYPFRGSVISASPVYICLNFRCLWLTLSKWGCGFGTSGTCLGFMVLLQTWSTGCGVASP